MLISLRGRPNQSDKTPQMMERTVEVSEQVLASVKEATFAHFTNGKVHDVELVFEYDEDGEICIVARLIVEPNITSEDYGGKLLYLLRKINDICSKEYSGIPALLDFKSARVST